MKDLDEVLAYLATELLGWVYTQEYDGYFVYDESGNNKRHEVDCQHLLTGNGMLEILTALREQKDLLATIQTEASLPNAAVARCVLSNGLQVPGYSNAKTLPEAVARAAYAALQEQDQ